MVHENPTKYHEKITNMENPQGQPDDAGVLQLPPQKKKRIFQPPKNALDLGLPSVVQEGLLKTSGFCAFFSGRKNMDGWKPETQTS